MGVNVRLPSLSTRYIFRSTVHSYLGVLPFRPIPFTNVIGRIGIRRQWRLGLGFGLGLGLGVGLGEMGLGEMGQNPYLTIVRDGFSACHSIDLDFKVA